MSDMDDGYVLWTGIWKGEPPPPRTLLVSRQSRSRRVARSQRSVIRKVRRPRWLCAVCVRPQLTDASCPP